MPISDLLHAIGIQCQRCHGSTWQPAVVVPHSVIDLQGVNSGQIEVDKERCLQPIRDWRALRAELGFDPIKETAPEPVVLALSKNWPLLDASFVGPQGSGCVAVCPELVVSFCLWIPIGTPPWHGGGVDINEGSIRSIIVMYVWSLRAGVAYEEAGLGCKRLNICRGVDPS